MLACTALPALAQEQSAPDPADSLAGTIFRWLNFALVFGGIVYLIRKVGAPYFRENAEVDLEFHSTGCRRARRRLNAN